MVTARKAVRVLAKVAAVALVLAYFGGCVVYIAAWSEGPTPGWAWVGGWVVLLLLAVGLGAALAMGLVRLAERLTGRRDHRA
jgi:TRAP-type C4-dicarboxylate transport system permease small subunit